MTLPSISKRTLVSELLPVHPGRKRRALIKQAGRFFAAAILPTEKLHRGAREATAHLKKIVESLSQRTVELAAANLELNVEIAQRKAVETALKKSKRHYSELLGQSDRMQEQLRQLSRQILSAQEDCGSCFLPAKGIVRVRKRLCAYGAARQLRIWIYKTKIIA